MYSDTEVDSKGNCLMRVMEELPDVENVVGINLLRVDDCWIHGYDGYSKENQDKYYAYDRKVCGFSLKEVMEVYLDKRGYYIAEFLTEEPLTTEITFDPGGYGHICTMTLQEAIKNFLDGCLSDGIGENEVGVVKYNGTIHEVWLGEAEEIK